MALSVPSGFFSQTCSNVTLTAPPAANGMNTFTLSATCKDANGNNNSTKMLFNVNNCNGKLTWDPKNSICPSSEPWS